MPETGTFKCPKCDRTFSMPSHLGRHVSTIHAETPTAPPGGNGLVVDPTGAAPAAELVSSLRVWREKLAIQIAALDQLLATLGDTAMPAARPGRGRPVGSGARGGGSLRSFIRQVLQQSGKPMHVVEITDAVLNAGYQTKNKTLAKSVGITLAKMPDVKKIERGVFTVK